MAAAIWRPIRTSWARPLTSGGEPYTVIGVLAPGFTFDPPPDLYMPFQADPNSTNQGHYFRAAARLKPGVSLDAAKAELNLAGGEFEPPISRGLGPKNSFTVEPMQQIMVSATYGGALHSAGRGRLRAVHRLRQRGQPAAGAGHRPFARDRHPVGHRRGARPHYPAVAHRKRAAVAGGGLLGLVIGALGVRALLAVNPATFRASARRRRRHARSGACWALPCCCRW